MKLYELLAICKANYLAIVKAGQLRPCWEHGSTDEKGRGIEYLDVCPAEYRYLTVTGFAEYYDPKHGAATMIEVK